MENYSLFAIFVYIEIAVHKADKTAVFFIYQLVPEWYDVFGKLRAVYPNLMALDFDNSRTRAEGAVALAGEVMKEKNTMELFRDFFEQQAGAELTPMQEQIITDIIEKNGEE